jgi:4-carboxymuconolactone decarboxylase
MTMPLPIKGLREFKAVLGDVGERVFQSLAPTSSDLARLLVEYPFGEIYNRPGLDLKTREIVAIASLAALGTARPQLKMHVQAAVRVGCTRDEIKEILLMTTVFAGFPAALNGMDAVREAFEEIDAQASQGEEQK